MKDLFKLSGDILNIRPFICCSFNVTGQVFKKLILAVLKTLFFPQTLQYIATALCNSYSYWLTA
jgi:hypothetical protein